MARADRFIAIIVLLAIAVSIVHYADNYTLYEQYPTSDTLPNPSAGLIAFSWFLFTAFAIAGLYFLRKGNSMAAGISLAAYSGSGLVGILHYVAGGTGEFPWWRHAHISADIVLGFAVFACAIYLVRRPRPPGCVRIGGRIPASRPGRGNQSPTEGTVMSDNSIGVYLNDHLGGSMLGTELAAEIRDRAEGKPLGEAMRPIAAEIEEDQATLAELMDRMDISRNPVKAATGWLAEKASRVKFSGATAGDAEYGTFMALETLRLGVAGKECLWRALRQAADQHPALAELNFDQLIERAARQQQVLEAERMKAGATALTADAPHPAAP